jgi:Ca2+/Na+ antiporter
MLNENQDARLAEQIRVTEQLDGDKPSVPGETAGAQRTDGTSRTLSVWTSAKEIGKNLPDSVKHNLRITAISAGGLVVSVLILRVLWWDDAHLQKSAWQNAWPVTAIWMIGTFCCQVGLVLGLVRCLFYFFHKEHSSVRLIALSALIVFLIGLTFYGDLPARSIGVGSLIVLLPPYLIWFKRERKRLRNWTKASAPLAVSYAPSAVESGTAAAPASSMPHQLLHSTSVAKKCTIPWDRMKSLGDGCLRTCDKCDLQVFKPDDLKPIDIAYVSQWQQQQRIARNDSSLYRRFDGTYVLGDCLQKRSNHLPMGVLIAPLVMPALGIMAAPGFIMPFFNHPVARFACLCALGWHVVGCWLFTRTANRALRILIFLGFTLPAMLMPALGPAIITILQALGPVMFGK